MKIRIDDDFDLKKIAESGQCFRWKLLSDNESYLIPAYDRYVIAKQLHENNSTILDLSCNEEDYNHYWKYYFDLDTNYKSVNNLITSDDTFLYEAMIHEKGIRILEQPTYETFISFIILQQNNIPKIKKSIEMLCTELGTKLGTVEGEDVYSFPKPEAIANLNLDDKRFSLGYRLDYIIRMSILIANHPDFIFFCDSIENDEEFQDTLMKFKGIGPKVSSCIMLYGFHRLNAFPIDTWMEKVLDKYYSNSSYDFKKYNPYNGIMQQYMFAYYRSLNL